MHEVITTDRQRIAVARDNPNVQLGASRLKAAGESRSPTVNAVHSVGVHIIRKTTRSTDTANEHGILLRRARLSQNFFHLGQDRIVATTGAPTNVLIRSEVSCF